ncbi:MAG TPA: S41 family peptidase [Nannocystaceae bacterium]|nr:S41 family peptidase [Nannocystaceae bacterium]
MPLRRCLALALAVSACQPAATTSPGDPQPTSADTPARDVTAANDDAPKCRDWSTLDRKTLPELPKSAHAALLEQVWGIVLEKHYDPTLACLDWPAVRVRYGEKVAAAKTDDEAYATINAMLAELKQSHLGLIPPRRAAAAEPGEVRPVGRGRAPLEVMMLGDELVVSNPAWAGKSSKLPPGATIVKIDDHEIDALVKEVGTAWPRKVERDFRLLRAAYAMLSCNPGDKKKIGFKKGAKHNPATVSIACHLPEQRTLSFGNLQDVPVDVRWAMIPKSDVGVVSFNVWLLPLADEIAKAVAELRGKGMKHLVIDLRGNPGGVGMMVVPVARLLLDKDAELGVMHMRDAEQRFAVKKGPDPFTGKVAILVDEGTGSTSEIFAQALHDLGRVIVVGTGPSQGAALPSLIEKLEGGAMLQYVVADYQSPAGIAVEGNGVKPDVLVEITREDLRNGRDPVLDAAVTALSKP